VLREANLAAQGGRGGAQEARHQELGEEANQEGEVQQVPRLQRPCVDDDPW